jgi:hypothetical protein
MRAEFAEQLNVTIEQHVERCDDGFGGDADAIMARCPDLTLKTQYEMLLVAAWALLDDDLGVAISRCRCTLPTCPGRGEDPAPGWVDDR